MDSENKMNILPIKYSKFATFAYWFLDQLKTSHIIPEESYTAICEFTHLTDGDIPLQVGFYERFLDEYDSLSKVFKALNKKPKSGKNNKRAQEKKTKTKKNNNSFNANLDIISQVVLRANSVDVEDDFDLTTPAVNMILQDVASRQEDVSDNGSDTSVLEDDAAEEKPKEKKVKEPKEKREKKVKEPKEKKEKEPKEPKEKKVKEPKEKKPKGGEIIKESEPKSVDHLVTTTQEKPQPQVINIVVMEQENPVVEPRKNTPILVQKKEKKEKKVKEPKENKDKEPKEKKEKKEKKVKQPKEPKEKKEKKSKKNGENKEEEKPVIDSERGCASTTINTHLIQPEKPSQTELSVSDEIEEGNKEENEDDDEEDVELYVVMIDDVEHYYDDAKNLYNDQQIIIGTFDPATKDISYFEEK